MPTLITAGDASNGVVVTSSNDNALTIQTGPNGGKVNAIALASDGTMTLNKPMAGGSLTLATAQATTSGTAIDFTGIPSWVKRITVTLNGVSTSGTSNTAIQIGSGSIDSSGYLGSAVTSIGGSNNAGTVSTTRFLLSGGGAASDVVHGVAVLVSMGGNLWAYSFTGAHSQAANSLQAGGTKTLSGALDRVRLTTVNGTDTFDAGSVNIMYEG